MNRRVHVPADADERAPLVRVLAEAPSSAGELRTAAPMPMAVLQAVDASIAGEPLDAAAEEKARDAGWR